MAKYFLDGANIRIHNGTPYHYFSEEEMGTSYSKRFENRLSLNIPNICYEHKELINDISDIDDIDDINVNTNSHNIREVDIDNCEYNTIIPKNRNIKNNSKTRKQYKQRRQTKYIKKSYKNRRKDRKLKEDFRNYTSNYRNYECEQEFTCDYYYCSGIYYGTDNDDFFLFRNYDVVCYDCGKSSYDCGIYEDYAGNEMRECYMFRTYNTLCD